MRENPQRIIPYSIIRMTYHRKQFRFDRIIRHTATSGTDMPDITDMQ